MVRKVYAADHVIQTQKFIINDGAEPLSPSKQARLDQREAARLVQELEGRNVYDSDAYVAGMNVLKVWTIPLGDCAFRDIKQCLMCSA